MSRVAWHEAHGGELTGRSLHTLNEAAAESGAAAAAPTSASTTASQGFDVLAQLPYDLAARVLAALPPHTRGRIPAVCKAWRGLMAALPPEQLWQELDFTAHTDAFATVRTQPRRHTASLTIPAAAARRHGRGAQGDAVQARGRGCGNLAAERCRRRALEPGGKAEATAAAAGNNLSQSRTLLPFYQIAAGNMPRWRQIAAANDASFLRAGRCTARPTKLPRAPNAQCAALSLAFRACVTTRKCATSAL